MDACSAIQIFHVHILLGTFMCIVILATGTAGNSMHCMRTCGLNGACKYIDMKLGCQLHALLDSACSCSITARTDGSTHSYASLIPRPRPAFCHLQCAELDCKDVDSGSVTMLTAVVLITVRLHM